MTMHIELSEQDCKKLMDGIKAHDQLKEDYVDLLRDKAKVDATLDKIKKMFRDACHGNPFYSVGADEIVKALELDEAEAVEWVGKEEEL